MQKGRKILGKARRLGEGRKMTMHDDARKALRGMAECPPGYELVDCRDCNRTTSHVRVENAFWLKGAGGVVPLDALVCSAKGCGRVSVPQIAGTTARCKEDVRHDVQTRPIAHEKVPHHVCSVPQTVTVTEEPARDIP